MKRIFASTDHEKIVLAKYVDRLIPPPIRSAEVELAFRRVQRHRLGERFYVPNEESSTPSGYREVVAHPSPRGL